MNETFRLFMTGCSGDKLWNYSRQLPKFYMVDPKNNKEKGFAVYSSIETTNQVKTCL